nr:MAG TPA: hypothetical protein [Caudoviricetes sp.]
MALSCQPVSADPGQKRGVRSLVNDPDPYRSLCRAFRDNLYKVSGRFRKGWRKVRERFPKG